MRSIGDALSEKNIPWKYYGGGYSASGVATNPFNGSYCQHLQSVRVPIELPGHAGRPHAGRHRSFRRPYNGTLPAVSYVKPDGLLDGHPASSKFGLFEAFVDNIIKLAQSNKEQWKETQSSLPWMKAAAITTPVSSSRSTSSAPVRAFP